MTEISYLIDLLLNHKLPKVTRENIRARIQLLEQNGATQPGAPRPVPVAQAQIPAVPSGPPVAVSQAAAQALADREAMISAAVTGQTANSVFKKHREHGDEIQSSPQARCRSRA